MLVSNKTPLNVIEIWTPRYHDRTVMVACYKVKTHNKIIFTKAKHLLGREYYLGISQAKKCDINNNGKIPCYCVPLDELEPLEYEEDVAKFAKSLF
jgi:hypothetical protein